MAACRRISFLTKKSQNYLLKCNKLFSTGPPARTETGAEEIVIPYRIERGPTDILKALASTVSKDFTAPHYKYEDDPYLIPSSNITKRSFALSKESGKKAARYFLENYPQFFKCNTSVPHIKAFDPPVIYTEENVSSVEDLKYCINENELDNSVTVYNILISKGIAVDQEVKQDLLELLCYYNSSQPLSDEYYEERFFVRNDSRYAEKWNAKGMAEKLFEEMEKDALAYSAMISGAAKFQNADRAMTLYEDMQSKNMTPTVNAFNGLISVIHLLKEDHGTRWEFAFHLMGTMNSQGIAPNLYTMNALFELLTRCTKWKKTMQISCRLLAEMKKLNIEPSLGTYCHLVMIFCTMEYSNTSIMLEVMKEVEGKDHEIRHPSDVLFFETAMEVCWKVYKDKDLAFRVHKLLEHGNNCKLLGNALSESQYFKCFFRLLCETEEMDRIMEIYEKYVPNSYTPEPSVSLNIIQAIHFNGSYRHLPKMCSDVLLFEQTERENILNLLMEAAGCMKHEEKVQADTVAMVWNILEKLKSRSEGRRLKFDWTGVLFGNILQTFINGKDIEKSWAVVKDLKEKEQTIIGYPDKNILLKFCELCLENADYEKVSYCMKYAINSSCPNFDDDLKKLTNTMFEQNKLNEKQRVHVDSLFQSTSNVEDTSSDSSSSDSSSDSSSSDEEEEIEKKK